MKITKRQLPLLLRLGLVVTILTTLIWGILEKTMQLAGIPFDLTLGPLGFDIYIVQFYLRINPGTLAGVPLTLFIYNKI